MRKWITATIAVSALLISETARCDIFGGDDAILSQILVETIEQLYQLQAIFRNGTDTLGLLQEINAGINDSLALATTLGIHLDPGLYAGIGDVTQAMSLVEQTFGRTPRSPLAPVQRNTDQSVAEAVTLGNDVDTYTGQMDQVGENIKTYSHVVSPGGAEKLTAESIGVLIHVVNEHMRISNQGLKLQAQALALQNKRDKDQTGQYLGEAQALKAHMTSADVGFELPRF